MLLRLRQQGVVCSSWSIATFLFLFSALLAAGAAEDAAPASSAQPVPSPEDYFGVYRSDDGAEARLYQPGGEQAWAMSYVGPGENPMLVTMEGDPTALRPVGLDLTISFQGKPLSVVGDSSGLYAKGSSDGGLIECLSTDGGTEVALDGKDLGDAESPERMSAAMTIGEVAQLWKRMQHTRVQVADKRLRIIPPNSDPQRVNAFARTAALSDDDKLLLESAFSNRLARLQDKNGFTNRERKQEDEP